MGKAKTDDILGREISLVRELRHEGHKSGRDGFIQNMTDEAQLEGQVGNG